MVMDTAKKAAITLDGFDFLFCLFFRLFFYFGNRQVRFIIVFSKSERSKFLEFFEKNGQFLNLQNNRRFLAKTKS